MKFKFLNSELQMLCVMNCKNIFKDFPDFSIPMIIFKTFQGIENFYIKFQDFPYFSRICTNPVHPMMLAAFVYLHTGISV